MTANTQIVFDEWNGYPAQRDGASMVISFDVAVTRGERPRNLELCARVMIPIHSPNESGCPVSPESEVLWEMEDELVAMLDQHTTTCRLVARLTYNGLRELVFQLQDWESFRPPVGLWIMKHDDYELDVSEHEGWDFFDSYIQPDIEDHYFMADRSVVDSLVKNGSDPQKQHSLEFVFMGPSEGLTRLADSLRDKGYMVVGELNANFDRVILAKALPLDLSLIVQESVANRLAAENMGVEYDGWGAAVVS